MKHMQRRREGALTRLEENIKRVKREINRKSHSKHEKALRAKLNKMESEAAILKNRLSL